MRRLIVRLHRYAGLGMAAFLIIEGLTGSALAFYNDLERLISPQFYATPIPGADPLDFAQLAARAAALVPQGQVTDVSFYNGVDQAMVAFSPRNDPATGKPYDLGFTDLFVDPWTGRELGRRKCCAISEGVVNLMPFIYGVHASLSLGQTGVRILGMVALVWTLDCFIGAYLTLPVTIAELWRRWRPSWLIKTSSGSYRLNLDLHRASGLWLWPLLFIFAWSSVMLTVWPIYERVTRVAFDLVTPQHYLMMSTPMASEPRERTPTLDWRSAQVIAQRLMNEQAARRGFMVRRPLSLDYDPVSGSYTYVVQSTIDVDDLRGGVTVEFDGDDGRLLSSEAPAGEPRGNAISNWLSALHLGNAFGFPYRVVVCGMGIVIAMLPATGIYLWWRKRAVRRLQARSARLLSLESM